MDEEQAIKKAGYEIGTDISGFSVDELNETIDALNEEISRLETAAREKSDHLSAAASLFKL